MDKVTSRLGIVTIAGPRWRDTIHRSYWGKWRSYTGWTLRYGMQYKKLKRKEKCEEKTLHQFWVHCVHKSDGISPCRRKISTISMWVWNSAVLGWADARCSAVAQQHLMEACAHACVQKKIVHCIHEWITNNCLNFGPKMLSPLLFSSPRHDDGPSAPRKGHFCKSQSLFEAVRFCDCSNNKCGSRAAFFQLARKISVSRYCRARIVHWICWHCKWKTTTIWWIESFKETNTITWN